MPWTRLDDGFFAHPKILPLSDAAFRLYVSGLNWSVARSTDGVIPDIALALALPMDSPRVRLKAAAELEAAGLWIRNETAWHVHDFADYQETKEEVAAKRERWATNKQSMRLFYASGIADEVRKRDRGLCRYCGKVVNWNDRRSGDGGTYDHIIPDGPALVDNMVVACRSCNSAKGARTPEQAGMELIPIQNRSRSDLDPGPKSVSASQPNPSPPGRDLNLDPSRGLTLAIEEAAKDPLVRNPKRVGRYRFERDPVKYNARYDLQHTELPDLGLTMPPAEDWKANAKKAKAELRRRNQ